MASGVSSPLTNSVVYVKLVTVGREVRLNPPSLQAWYGSLFRKKRMLFTGLLLEHQVYGISLILPSKMAISDVLKMEISRQARPVLSLAQVARQQNETKM